MSRSTLGTPYYTTGYKEEYIEFLSRRDVGSHAAHLIPYLKPGLRVLDFGCGPGTITVDLAKIVGPGEVHGIDMEASQIAIARSSAEEGGHDNVTFHVGDATDLPFDNDFFDIAHCHSVLMFVPNTRALLTEVMRVLKPGGIISSRETIIDSSFLEPAFYRLDDLWELYSNFVRSDDGHPDMGKEMKDHILKAGFMDVRATASFNVYSTTEDIAFFYTFVEGWFLSDEIVDAAVEYGAGSHRQFDDVRRALRQWSEHPSAFGAIAYGEAIASKP